MLNDGQVIDSSVLPQSAIECHPVTVSAESLMQSITHSLQSVPGSEIYTFGQQDLPSGMQEGLVPEQEPQMQYHRIVLTDGASTLTNTASAIPGALLRLFFPVTYLFQANPYGSNPPGSPKRWIYIDYAEGSD